MSLFILDTDIVSLFQHRHPAVVAAVQRRAPSEVVITVLTVEEQLSGWYREMRRTKKPPRLAAVYDRMARSIPFLGSLTILSFSEPAILRYHTLNRLKLNVGKNDLRIAAIALEANAIVVTRNVGDFGRVPGLTIEDWSK